MEKKGTISSLIMPVFAVLLCLTLLSTWLMSNMYARYTTQATGEDSARVAIFGHNESITVPDSITSRLKPGSSAEYGLKIANYSSDRVSEVALKYNLEIQTAGNLPLKFTLNKKNVDSNNTVIGEFTESSNSKSHSFSTQDMQFAAAQEKDVEYTLKIEWQEDKNGDGLADIPDYIQININVEQAD